jgi:hypothetical protein
MNDEEDLVEIGSKCQTMISTATAELNICSKNCLGELIVNDLSERESKGIAQITMPTPGHQRKHAI